MKSIAQHPATVQEAADQVRQLVAALFEPDDLVEVRTFITGREQCVHRGWWRAAELHQHAEAMREWNDTGENIYFSANPRNGRGGTKEYVSIARCLFAAFDDTGSPEAIRQRIIDADLPAPTVLLCSGHGVHAYWRLSDPLSGEDGLQLWIRLQRGITRAVASDPKVNDLARVMRLPGFINHKVVAI